MCYFSNVLRYPAATVDTICHTLNDPKFGRVDLIVGTGISGILILVPVSIQSGIPFGAVRKVVDAERWSSEGGSHSSAMIETFLPKGHKVHRYIIIDDFISSGGTVRSIKQTMAVQYNHVQCVGIILYQSNKNDQTEVCLGVPITRLYEDILELSGGVINI